MQWRVIVLFHAHLVNCLASCCEINLDLRMRLLKFTCSNNSRLGNFLVMRCLPACECECVIKFEYNNCPGSCANLCLILSSKAEINESEIELHACLSPQLGFVILCCIWPLFGISLDFSAMWELLKSFNYNCDI